MALVATFPTLGLSSNGSLATFNAASGIFADSTGPIKDTTIRIGMGLSAIGTSTVQPNVTSGDFKDITIAHTNGKSGQQAAYVKIAANSPICLASIGVTWAGGGQFAWLGDMGQFCSYKSLVSNTATTIDSKNHTVNSLFLTTSFGFWNMH